MDLLGLFHFLIDGASPPERIFKQVADWIAKLYSEPTEVESYITRMHCALQT